MMIGMNDETGPLAIIIRKAMLKINQNLMSYSDSQTWAILKCLLRTPELFSFMRATAMYRSRSLKPLARIGSGGRKKRMTRAHKTVIDPATRYMYCHELRLPPLMCPSP